MTILPAGFGKNDDGNKGTTGMALQAIRSFNGAQFQNQI